MLALANLAIRKPRGTLAVCVALVAALAAIGLGVWHSVSPSIVVVPGTESSRAQELANARFGPTQLVPILLQGPTRQLDKQGPRLVRDLVRRPHTRALSAWDAGVASAGLRLSANAAMIVVSVDRAEKDVVNTDQPQIEALVRRDVAAPVRASVTGQPSIDRALKDEALSTTRRSELIALGILFVLLLLGLRAPLAAGIVTLIGAGVVLSAFGLMALLGKLIDTDAVAVALASMTGLALGVGYSLLILDRFHQRLGEGEGEGVRDAARDAVAGAGRAVLFAGTGLILALLLASAIAPTKILTSLGIGVLLCSALAVGAAVVVMPAALVLFERSAAIGWMAPSVLGRDWDRLVGAGAWVRHHAAIAGALATAALVALAVPVFSLQTGPPDVSQLPASNSARKAFEEVARVMGPGWPTPYNVIVASSSGPITTAATLQKLDRLQTQIAADPRVASVTGPGALSGQTRALGKLPKSLNESGKLLKGGKRDLGRLVAGLGLAGSGARELQSGLAAASSGATQLHGGSGEADGRPAPGAGGRKGAEEGLQRSAGGLGGHQQRGRDAAGAGVGERVLGEAPRNADGGDEQFGLRPAGPVAERLGRDRERGGGAGGDVQRQAGPQVRGSARRGEERRQHRRRRLGRSELDGAGREGSGVDRLDGLGAGDVRGERARPAAHRRGPAAGGAAEAAARQRAAGGGDLPAIGRRRGTDERSHAAARRRGPAGNGPGRTDERDGPAAEWPGGRGLADGAARERARRDAVERGEVPRPAALAEGPRRTAGAVAGAVQLGLLPAGGGGGRAAGVEQRGGLRGERDARRQRGPDRGDLAPPGQRVADGGAGGPFEPPREGLRQAQRPAGRGRRPGGQPGGLHERDQRAAAVGDPRARAGGGGDADDRAARGAGAGGRGALPAADGGGDVRRDEPLVQRLGPAAGRPGLHRPDVDRGDLHDRVRGLADLPGRAAGARARGAGGGRERRRGARRRLETDGGGEHGRGRADDRGADPVRDDGPLDGARAGRGPGGGGRDRRLHRAAGAAAGRG